MIVGRVVYFETSSLAYDMVGYLKLYLNAGSVLYFISSLFLRENCNEKFIQHFFDTIIAALDSKLRPDDGRAVVSAVGYERFRSGSNPSTRSPIFSSRFLNEKKPTRMKQQNYNYDLSTSLLLRRVAHESIRTLTYANLNGRNNVH